MCGIPKISIQCEGLESFLTKNTGNLIEPDNTKKLTEAMKSLIENYTTYEPEKLKHIAEGFSNELIGEKYTENT